MQYTRLLFLIVVFSLMTSYYTNAQMESGQPIKQIISSDSPDQYSGDLKAQQIKNQNISDQKLKQRERLRAERLQQKHRRQIIDLVLKIILIASIVVLILIIGLCFVLLRRQPNTGAQLLALMQAQQKPGNLFHIKKQDILSTHWVKISTEENQEFSLKTAEEVCTVCSSINRQCDTVTECNHYFHIHCLQQFLQENLKCPNCDNKKQRITNLKTFYYCPSCFSFQTYFPSTRNFLAFAKYCNNICQNCQVKFKQKKESQLQNKKQCKTIKDDQDAYQQTNQQLVKEKSLM